MPPFRETHIACVIIAFYCLLAAGRRARVCGVRTGQSVIVGSPWSTAAREQSVVLCLSNEEGGAVHGPSQKYIAIFTISQKHKLTT